MSGSIELVQASSAASTSGPGCRLPTPVQLRAMFLYACTITDAEGKSGSYVHGRFNGFPGKVREILSAGGTELLKVMLEAVEVTISQTTEETPKGSRVWDNFSLRFDIPRSRLLNERHACLPAANRPRSKKRAPWMHKKR